MIHLDTHVVIWLYEAKVTVFSATARDLIDSEDLAISPMTRLELSWLREVGRIKPAPIEIVDSLRRSIGLRTADDSFDDVAARAAEDRFSFTRDPFDRLISAHADVAGARLLTRDAQLRQHLDFAIWP